MAAQQVDLDIGGHGFAPCPICGATDPRDCHWSYMHCTRPDNEEGKPAITLSRCGRYWRWLYQSDGDED